MAYVIAEPCNGMLNRSCVEVCPVDCIHPLADADDFSTVEQLYIDPHECIDCNACVDVCPVDAIYPADTLPDEWRHYEQINADYFAKVA